MGSTYGENLKFTIFGQSHGPAIGVTVEGLPAGFSIDMDELSNFLVRRAPGLSPLSTGRKEQDAPRFISGLVGNVTCGVPLTAIIPNNNTRPEDYDKILDCPRPGHADFTGRMKYGGFEDIAGGGHFSGRLTAPLCIVGGICKQLLAKQGVTIAAHMQSIAHVQDVKFDPVNVNEDELRSLLCSSFPVLNQDAAEEMKKVILEASSQGNSVGGVIECATVGLPAGWGDPMFGGLENRISQAVFAIPAVRGIEFGTGFAAASMPGSQHNDPYYMDGEDIKTCTNNHGGILGGISSSMPLIFRTAIKPTASIALEQQTVSFSQHKAVSMKIVGRHDPCIVPRAVPCIEAAAAVALYDAFLEQRKRG